LVDKLLSQVKKHLQRRVLIYNGKPNISYWYGILV